MEHSTLLVLTMYWVWLHDS